MQPKLQGYIRAGTLSPTRGHVKKNGRKMADRKMAVRAFEFAIKQAGNFSVKSSARVLRK
jgi:hypothetical protein